MKRLWIALTTITAGLWFIIWRLRKNPPITPDDSVGVNHDLPVTTSQSAPVAAPKPTAPPSSAPLNRATSNSESSVRLATLVPDVRRARLIQNVILSVFGVVLGLLFVWLGARLFFPQRPSSEASQFEAAAVGIAGCEPAPGDWTRGTGAAGLIMPTCRDYFWREDPFAEYFYNIQMNNFGLHDTMMTMDKPEGVYRILIVGDSFPAGTEVPMTNGFAYLLERQLNVENDGSRQPVEVINLSVPAIGTDRELLLYAGLGWRFQADVVILCVYTGNDIQDNDIDLEHRRYSYRLNRPFFTLEDGNLQLHNSLISIPQLYADSPASVWFLNMQASQTEPPPENPPARPLVTDTDPYQLEYPVELGIYLPPDEYWTRSWELTERLIVQFRDLVEAEGSTFAVMIIPDRRAIHPEDWDATINTYPIVSAGNPLEPISHVARFLSQNRITTINLTTSLREVLDARPTQRLYYPGDGHFNLQGHYVTSQVLHEWILEQGLLPAIPQ